MEDQLEGLGVEPKSRPGQEDPAIPFLVGAKTKTRTRSANKKGPSTETPASTKRPTKTPGRGSSSKRLKRKG